jgi:homoserine O-succinyltransferase
MPIKIPDDLPARRTLEAEGLVVMSEADAIRQDIRPLRIGLLNLMPDKISTETQLARLIGATPLQVELTLVRITNHVSRHTEADHMASFYRPWEAVRDERFDGFIITGAPIEKLPFDAVTYWDELRRIFDWTQTHVHRGFMVCWAAQAALNHFHGVPKHILPAKAFGVIPHRVTQPASPWLRGFPDNFGMPVSRWTEVRQTDLPASLNVLAASAETGIGIIEDPARRMLHCFNHLEYDSHTLDIEYKRDVNAGVEIKLPANYYPHSNPALPPENCWRGHGHLLFGNWINEIYQTTPFEMDEIGR